MINSLTNGKTFQCCLLFNYKQSITKVILKPVNNQLLIYFNYLTAGHDNY